MISDLIKMATGPDGDDGLDEIETGVVTRTRPKTKKPSNYKVLMLNDDYTPMEFVVLVLQRFFTMGIEDATRVMLQVHQQVLDGDEFMPLLARFDKRHVQTDFQLLRNHAASIMHCSGWPSRRAAASTSSTLVAAMSFG